MNELMILTKKDHHDNDDDDVGYTTSYIYLSLNISNEKYFQLFKKCHQHLLQLFSLASLEPRRGEKKLSAFDHYHY